MKKNNNVAYDPYAAAEARRELNRLLNDIAESQMYGVPLGKYRASSSDTTWAGTAFAAVVISWFIYQFYKGSKSPKNITEAQIRQQREQALLASQRTAYHLISTPDTECATKAQAPGTRMKSGTVILTENAIQESRRHWKREQAIQRFGPEQQRPSKVSKEQVKIETTKLAETSPSAPKPKKKKSRIKLPEPERFLPKTPTSPQDPEVKEPSVHCQPVGASSRPTFSPSSTGPNGALNDRVQEALIAALTRANGDSKKRTREEDAALVYQEGMTRFLHVPYLPNADHTSFLLKKLAKEFLPIVKRRGYNILLVSEMCCCTDGSKAAQGEQRNKNRIKTHTASGSEDMCGGYNRTIRLGKDKTVHQIYIRLRDRINHYKFKSYKEISRTMAHELAHCEHGGHGPAFQKLMKEIQEEHKCLLLSGEVNQNASAEEQFGFDIYGTSNSRTRF